ncbi:hypothetical protein [Candidatus Alkanophaga liquidiphilum]
MSYLRRWYHKKNEVWHTDDEEAYMKEVLEWWDRIPDQRKSMKGTWRSEEHGGKSWDELVVEEAFHIGLTNLMCTFVVAAALWLLVFYLWVAGTL